MYHLFVGLHTKVNITIEPEHQNTNATQPLRPARPFVSAAFAGAILDCSKYSLQEYIENHRLPMAFNIALPGATRLCLRVAAASVMAVRTGLKPPVDLVKFLDSAIPKDKPFYPPPRLAWLLDCDNDHIYHLLAAGALADAGDATRYLIPRESVMDFLSKRQLP
jgi:hypothetical protein